MADRLVLTGTIYRPSPDMWQTTELSFDEQCALAGQPGSRVQYHEIIEVQVVRRAVVRRVCEEE